LSGTFFFTFVEDPLCYGHTGCPYLSNRSDCARPQERMGRHRALHAGSAQGWDLLPAGLLDSSVLQVFAHARARTCPASLRRLLAGRGRAVVLAMHRRSAGHYRQFEKKIVSKVSAVAAGWPGEPYFMYTCEIEIPV
jgi:hypothetical protein